jgi:transcriptional regulator with GAF, ATPase, and Fis domain
MTKADGDTLYQKLTSIACSSLEIGDALQNSFDYLRQYIPADGLTLDIYQPDNSMMSIARASSNGVKLYDIKIPLTDASIKEGDENMFREDVMIFNAPDINPTSADFAKHFNLGETCSLVMNLITKGECLGSVAFYALGQGIYTRQHAEVLSQVKEPFTIAMLNALKYREVQNQSKVIMKENRKLYQELTQIHDNTIIGKESGLREVMAQAEQVASVDSPVILFGETGTGKDVIANAIHHLSDRRDKPIVKVNCGAIPENLIDSELFGHEKGSFTGAIAQKKGKFERAHGGTLFLDEVGELPLDAQVRLLRAIQFKEVERVGGSKTVSVDVRVIAATHRNLQELVRFGRFREDLYYRLNVFPIHIKPLRDRKEDIPLLAYYFIEKKSKDLNLPKPQLSANTFDSLLNYDWPGNVRELANVIERSLIINQNKELTFDISPSTNPQSRGKAKNADTFASLEEVIKEHISIALETTGGRVEGEKGAAKLLKLNPNTLRSKIKKYKINTIFSNR